jgi:hypothetical protein
LFTHFAGVTDLMLSVRAFGVFLLVVLGFLAMFVVGVSFAFFAYFEKRFNCVWALVLNWSIKELLE